METRLDMSIILAKLADQGVSDIRIMYDGSGDNGDIHSVEYIDSKDALVEIENKGDITTILEDLCYNDLLGQVGDWVNNEGGYGTVIINVSTGEYSIESHQRITSTEDDTFTGEIQEFYEKDI